MADAKRSAVRVLVPLVVLVVALGVTALAVLRPGSGGKPGGTGAAGEAASAPAAATPAVGAGAAAEAGKAETAAPGAAVAGAAATPAATAAATPPATTPAASPTAAAPANAPAAAGGTLTGLTARRWTDVASAIGQWSALGSVAHGADGKPETPYFMRVAFSHVGAGIDELRLARQYDKIGKGKQGEVLQRKERVKIPAVDSAGNATEIERVMVPMAMYGVSIDGQYVPLGGSQLDPIWNEAAPGAFVAEIIDGAGKPVARVERVWKLATESFDLELQQRLVNLTDRALTVVWHQAGPADLPIGVIRYGGDVRRVRLGYLPSPTINPDGQVVISPSNGTAMKSHANVLGEFNPGTGQWNEVVLWPQPATTTDQLSLSWAAVTNRYFAVAMHAMPGLQPKRADGKDDKSWRWVRQIDRVVLSGGAGTTSDLAKTAVMNLRLEGQPVQVAAGATMDTSVGVYAGPISPRPLRAGEQTRAVGLDGLVIYTFGGPCAFCTFQSVAYLLRWYLGVVHDYLVFDWAMAIILLVFTVRLILHPVQKWSQINLKRFGKQMQKVAPKQAALKEKYGNDPKRFREEVARLMAEEKINYGGALGCLPLLLQMPIWIALYAMIFFAFELRHEGAFYGLFQMVGHPTFLADLAEPDMLIPLGISFHVPLLSSLMGPIEGINLIPLLMGVVFYYQQKTMTPPTAGPMSPEMEMQMKITKFMMIFMFPLFMYNAPAALSLYFMTNSLLAIFESKQITATFDRQEKEREEAEKLMTPAQRRAAAEQAKAGKPGFFARMQTMMEQRMKEVERMKAEQEKATRRAK
ncbi:MAG: YidC/Oxa1 family membrane protein insertase [bacterium]